MTEKIVGGSAIAEKTKNRTEFEAQLVSRAWKDEKFREELVANPKAVLEKELGVKLPTDVQFTVLQEDAKHAYLVIPTDPRKVVQEMPDEQLKAVAGGTPQYAYYVATIS